MRLKSPEILQAFMNQKKFSMGRLATYSRCSKGFISHLLAGRKTSCTEELAKRIAEALDVPLVALFDPRTSADSGHHDVQERMAS
jgi:transcriptional regulator with XRE-family HTH domain